MSGVHNIAFESSENLNKDDSQNYQQKTNGENIDLTPMNLENDEQHETDTKRKKYKFLTSIILHLIFVTYFSYATYHYISTRDTCTRDCTLTLCSSYGLLLLVYGATYLGILYYKVIKPYLGDEIENIVFTPMQDLISSLLQSLIAKVAIFIVLSAAFFGYIIYETYSDFSRLRALIGIAAFSLIGFFMSENHKRIIWRPVICGGIFQFLLGIMFIRWPVGRGIFQCFGNKVSDFLSFGKDGAAFVFGNELVWDKQIFAFAVLPTIFFFSLCISVCYYLGAMQWVLFKLGWILQSILGTTVCESVNAAGNIFLGMSEGPLIIRPYIKYLTHSEIHALMVSGFATVSGSTMVAYIAFGAEPAHLITATVMAAPASLCFSKLVYPELEESKTSSNNIELEKSTDSSILDAASNGASQAIPLILNIIANLVAFVAFVTFADAILKWITLLMGFDNVDIQYILGKMFMPISWLIGVDWKDCEAVGNIIGTKTIINEFVAFKKLGEYKANHEISMRSAAIATFAICSFANPASMGIMIGALSALAPERKSSFTKVILKSFISGCFVTLCTASIAGLLMTDEI
ncbi:hypothetical protein ACKWTF_004895 [Chironomus riparius]